MAQLHVGCTLEWNSRTKRIIRIYLDGNQIGTISNGETKEFHLPKGKHTLEAKFSWFGSQQLPLNLKENDETQIELSCNMLRFMLPNLISFLAVLYFLINFIVKVINPLFFLVLFFPIVLYNFYVFTIGRTKSLNLMVR